MGNMAAGTLPDVKLERSDSLRRPALGREAEARLRGSGYLALRGVTCEARDGALHLYGCLPSYYLKQMAQSIATEVDGVCRVANHIVVVAPPRRVPVGRDRVAR